MPWGRGCSSWLSSWMCLKVAATSSRHDSLLYINSFLPYSFLFTFSLKEATKCPHLLLFVGGSINDPWVCIKLNFPVSITKIYVHSLHPVLPWIVFPIKKYIEVWILSTLERDLIWRQDLVDVIRMRSHWCRVGFSSEMAGILLRRWCNVKTQEGHVIDWSYAAECQGMPKMARKPGEVRERQGWIPLQVSKAHGLADMLILDI